MATAFLSRNDESDTSWPNWSRSVKSGAGAPNASPVVMGRILSPSGGGTSIGVEVALEHLAGRVARQLVEEDDLARHLVAGEVLLDVTLERLLVDRPLRDHEGAQPL